MGKNWILAGPCLFLLGLFLLPGGTTASTPKPQYLVLVPVVVRTETSRQICVQLNHLNESVTLSITLDYGLQNRSLLREEVSKKDLFKCIQFQLPKWETSFNSHIALFTVEVTGATLRYLNRKRVYIDNQESLLFVQTDKPIYKPGQKILFRVVSLNEEFLPVTRKVPLIYIEDPKRNRLFQWKDVELNGGLVQLEFPLSSEPALGTYKVVVQKDSERSVQHSCTVEEYVLPKFEVVVKATPTITILDNELKVTVCGKYTYGKPVPGLVSMRVCRRYSYFRSSCYGEESKAICEEFSGQADVHGCFSHEVNLKIFQLKRNGFQMEIRTEGVITEEGTDVVLTGSGTTQITSIISSISFENMDSYYKPGLPFSGELKLVDGRRDPLANKTIELQISEVQNNSFYKTDAEGRVRFSIETSSFTNDAIQLTATYEKVTHCYDSNWVTPQHHTGYFSASRFYSPSQSYLKIQKLPGTLNCGQHAVVPVHYVLNSEVIKDKEVVFHYLVVARGNIVKTGTHPLKEKHDKGTFNLDLLVDIKTAPLTRLLVYTILDNGELVVHSANFPVEPCFANKVNLRFAEPEGLPGSNINLHLAAAQNSLCGIHAVDESVFLLKPEAELSARTVYDLLPLKDLSGYYYKSENLEDPDTNPCVPPKRIIVDGIRYQTDTYSYGEGDAYAILRDIGFKPFTNAQIYKPNICSRPDLDNYHRVYNSMERGAPMAVPMAELKRDEAGEVETTVRSFFPETWIWSLKSLGSETELTLPVTIPDTITEWRAGAFCLSPAVGFGLAQTTFFKAFQPFFVELTLPYSVIRGEAFVLKATVYNYLKRPLQVSISLLLSPDYDAVPKDKEQASYCLPVDGRKTVSWNITPKSLGEVNFTVTAEALKSTQLCGNEIPEVPAKGQRDIVIKTLLVEPEGIEKEAVINNLLCGAKDSQSTAISLKVPENIVEKSARAFFCVLGDILSSAIQNVQQLLRLPSGCGEQNMALLAPNIYILDYLNSTDQLTEATKSKAISYLVSGYQRQLNYKHADGSYSTFGEGHNQPGDVWLTAFVLKSFSQMKRYISVEERHLIDAQTFLALKQKSNGCFQSTGTLLNNALKGGVDDEVTLSAYVTIGLLEMPLPVTHSVVRNALFCLETASQQKDLPIYTQALLGYAFALAHKDDKVAAILQSLQEKAVKGDDGSLHWERPVKPEAKQPFYYQPLAPSAEVEMTSYVLLTYMKRNPAAPTKDDLEVATKIVRWLTRQQNPSGGFASTQDTVVALQALSLYGAFTFSKNTAGSKVALKSGENNVKEFHVDNTNRLLFQCQALPSVPGEYAAVVTGESCIYVQTTLRYNVIPHPEDDPFALIVSTIPETCVGVKAHKEFDIAINVSYTGQRSSSNMAIINIKMVSGFAPNKPSVKKLEKQALIKRADITATNVVLYLEKLTNATEHISFTVERSFEIQNQRPAFVEVFDYYVDESTEVSYSAPCSTANVGNV